MTRLTVPAVSPLRHAIWTGSLAETLRVKLLSIAQHRQAATIASGPHGIPNSGRSLQESSAPAATMNTMPTKIRRSKFSLNTNHASIAVNTPSRLRRSEADDAGVLTSPTIRRTGPAMPPDKIAPASQGMSPFGTRAGVLSRTNTGLSANQVAKPRPLPK